jgi:hypothetical protein
VVGVVFEVGVEPANQAGDAEEQQGDPVVDEGDGLLGDSEVVQAVFPLPGPERSALRG